MKRLFTIGVISLFASLVLFTGCEKNVAPTLTLEADVVTVEFGETVNLTAMATDDDDDALTYTWSAASGTFDAIDAATAVWTAGDVAEVVTITCVVSDGEEEVTDTVDITVEEPIVEFDVLTEYLEADYDWDGNDTLDTGGYVNNLGSWIKGAGFINPDFDYTAYTVFDLRSAGDFAIMAIDGAINVTMGTMFDEAEIAPLPILVTCYSGQSASFAHMLLRLKGYEAYVMKFGMSSFDETLDKWTYNCSNDYAADFVFDASPALPTFDFPVLDTGFETAEEILDARIDAAITAWSAGMLITATDLYADLTLYNIMNYWGDDYTHYGHIDGAYQLIPATLTVGGNLSAFDPTGDNIFYCYTGQTAAASIAYLAVLGYDVKSIKFGANAMIWDEMSGHKWSKPYED